MTEGSITSDQEKAILSALEEALKTRKQQQDTTIDPLASIVTAGTITQDQSKSVQSTFQSVFESEM